MRRLEETYADDVEFHILNTDHASTRDLAMQYRVSAIPYIVMLDGDGNIVQEMVGFRDEDTLIAAVESLIAASSR